MPASIRRLARVLALQTLFEVDSTAHDPEQVLTQRLEDNGLAGQGAAFSRSLVHGVLSHVEELDQIIAAAAPNWPLEQMAGVDKNILRLAIYELRYEQDVPIKAIINEAVELGKRFGSESSSRFVNGVLGTVASNLEVPHDVPRPTRGWIRNEQATTTDLSPELQELFEDLPEEE